MGSLHSIFVSPKAPYIYSPITPAWLKWPSKHPTTGQPATISTDDRNTLFQREPPLFFIRNLVIERITENDITVIRSFSFGSHISPCRKQFRFTVDDQLHKQAQNSAEPYFDRVIAEETSLKSYNLDAAAFLATALFHDQWSWPHLFSYAADEFPSGNVAWHRTCAIWLDAQYKMATHFLQLCQSLSFVCYSA